MPVWIDAGIPGSMPAMPKSIPKCKNIIQDEQKCDRYDNRYDGSYVDRLSCSFSGRASSTFCRRNRHDSLRRKGEGNDLQPWQFRNNLKRGHRACALTRTPRYCPRCLLAGAYTAGQKSPILHMRIQQPHIRKLKGPALLRP